MKNRIENTSFDSNNGYFYTIENRIQQRIVNESTLFVFIIFKI